MSFTTGRRVVITGLGVLAPNGIGKEAFWQACLAGRSGIRQISRFDASALPTRIAGEIPDFNPDALGLTPQERVHLDRSTQLAIAAANLALQDAHLINALTEEERDRTGVFMGAAMASIEEGESLWVQLTNGGTQPLGAITEDIWFSDSLFLNNASAAAIAAHHQLHGPSTVISTGCSAGADAIGQAFWAIQEGQAERMLAGGTDSSISCTGINVFSIMGALSTRKDIAYVSLDGRALPSSDRGEAEALRATFGTDLEQLPVSVPRTMLGHSHAAAGALDTITALLALQHNLIPPTINCEELEPSYGLNLVRDEARPLSRPVVLLGGRGVGGANAVLAIRRSL